MKKYSNLLIVIFSTIFLIFIMLNRKLVSETILYSFYIWYNTLVPSMAPMIVLADILITYHCIDYLPKIVTKIFTKLFNISKEAVVILLLSLLSGFPTNAININKAYMMKAISKEEAEHLLLFTHFANPLFVLGTIGSFFLKDTKYGYIILASHLITAFLIGIIFRRKNVPSLSNYNIKKEESQNFGLILSSSIKKCVNSLLMVGATVSIFLVFSTLLCEVFNLNGLVRALVKGLLEMTMGLSEIAKLNISSPLKVALSTGIISFGGLSIHLQVISSLDENIKYRNYFIGRIIHCLLSTLIAIIISLILL